MAREREPWDRREDEPAASYLLFLAYRDMGPSRSVYAVWQAWLEAQGRTPPESGRKRKPPGNWDNLSSRFDWPKRARAWDIERFGTDGQDAILLTFRYIRQLAAKGLKALDKEGAVPGTDAWRAHLETVKELVSLIPEETIAALVRARDGFPGADGGAEVPS